MNTAFLTPQPALCNRYADSLAQARFGSWIITDFNDLHRLLKNECIDIMFIDHQMIDHKHFDVLSHIEVYRKDMLLFYFNQDTEQRNSAYESWQDQLSHFFPHYNTAELQIFLKTAAGTYSETQPPSAVYSRKTAFPVHFLDKNYPHTVCRSAVTLLELLYKNKNKDVSLLQMESYLWPEHSDSHIKTLYTYIHSLRDLLNDSHKSPKQVVKVRKGYYSLLVSE